MRVTAFLIMLPLAAVAPLCGCRGLPASAAVPLTAEPTAAPAGEQPVASAAVAPDPLNADPCDLDADPRVRADQIAALGRLGTDAARDALRAEARQTSGRARAAVVRALSTWGVEAVAGFADDPAWQVQQAVAQELARFETVPSAALLQQLAAARAPQVEAAAVESVRAWPDELAVPVLLAAMQDGTIVVRAEAFEALRRRRGMDADFAHTERDAGRRSAAIARLVREWNLSADLVPSRSIPPAAGRPPGEDAAATNSALLALDDPDHVVRRAAARRLADLARLRSLDAAALTRLAERLVRERDIEVWRFALEAILPDGTPESASIARLAAAHEAPDIRVLACRFARRHRRPEFAVWLQPLFGDPHRRVQLAAIEAAGHCGDRSVLADAAPLPGLGSLLQDANLRIRVAAAVAMCHLDDARGAEELLRLSHTSDPGLRREIMAAMNEFHADH